MLKTIIYSLLIFCSTYFFPLIAEPDLTIVGFFLPEDGLGKVPINILKTLGDTIDSNIKISRYSCFDQISDKHVIASLNNPDQCPGKVALLTATLGHLFEDPTSFVPNESIVKLAYSMLETTRIPQRWVETLNEKYDGVVVPDPFLVPVYEESGVRIPIFVLPIPMALDPYYSKPIHPEHSSNPFIFYDASANKNPLVLIEAFAAAFGDNEDVHLIMRAGNFYGKMKNQLQRLIKRRKLTNVTIEEGYLELDEYIEKLASVDCYVNLSRGEGFSFIPREALALGIPVIITDNTSSSTICKSGCIRAVPSDKLGPTNRYYKDLFGEACGKQFDCTVKDVTEALLDVFQNYPKYIDLARKGRDWVYQYDCHNPELRALYRTLIKPSNVILGEENIISSETITTNSQSLYQKYQQIINPNQSTL